MTQVAGYAKIIVMPIRTTMNVSLTPELEKFVESRVATGRYQTASEVVREGLRLLEEQERQREAHFQALKGKLRRGAAQAERGELIAGDKVFGEIRQHSARRRKE
ncbi:MAG: type II toxin-antitoxin system ParD family antitoxin [Tepidisphaeraceae bacterium]